MITILVILMMIIALIHLNLRPKKTGQTNPAVTKDVEIAALLIYLSTVWKTLQMP